MTVGSHTRTGYGSGVVDGSAFLAPLHCGRRDGAARLIPAHPQAGAACTHASQCHWRDTMIDLSNADTGAAGCADRNRRRDTRPAATAPRRGGRF